MLATALQQDSSFENLYLISKNASSSLYVKHSSFSGTPKKLVNVNTYNNSTASFVGSVPDTFALDYWTIKNGMLTFKTVGEDIGVNRNAYELANVGGTNDYDSPVLRLKADYEAPITEITIDNTFVSAKNKTQSDLVIKLGAYAIAQVDKVTVQSKNTTITLPKFDYKYDTLVIKHENIPVKGLLDVAIECMTATGDHLTIYTKAQVVDFAISTVAEWEEFGAYCGGKTNTSSESATDYTYVILTDNIDYKGALFTSYFLEGAFNGHFDGQGYTISNIMVRNSIFAGIKGESEANPAIIENVAFVNVTRSSGNGGAFLANMSRHVVYNNIYLTGRTSTLIGNDASGNANNYTAPAPALFNYAMVGYTNKVSNCVFVLQSDRRVNPNGSATKPSALYNDTANAGVSGTLTANNVYVVLNDPNGTYNENLGVVGNPTFNNVNKDTLDNFSVSSLGDFSADYWTIINGKLVFNSAIEYVSSVNMILKEVTISDMNIPLDDDTTIDTETLTSVKDVEIIVNEDGTKTVNVTAGSIIQVMLDNKFATITNNGLPEGITFGLRTILFNDFGEFANMHIAHLTFGDTVAVGTTFTLTALYNNPLTGETITDEIVFNVVA